MKTGPLWLWIVASLLLLAVLSFVLRGDPEHRHLSGWIVTSNDGTIFVAILVASILHRIACWAFRN